MIIIITKLYNIVNYEKNNIFITIEISEFNLGHILKI